MDDGWWRMKLVKEIPDLDYAYDVGLLKQDLRRISYA
jgi:hypothetical protein